MLTTERDTNADAIEQFNKTKASRDAAVKLLDMLGDKLGADDRQTERAKQEVAASLPKLDEAKSKLVARKSCTAEQILAKIAAVITCDPSPSELEELATQAKRVLETEDPVLELCERHLRVKARYRELLSECPTGNFDVPEIRELELWLHRCECELRKMTPTTPSGVAALADLYFRDAGPSCIPGTEGWEKERNTFEFQILSKLRDGAALVAGLNGDYRYGSERPKVNLDSPV